ncbi:MAG: hypothetical protein JWO86_6517, partial [Myxococcaceae bacterium]|nr:hypothetical protein [Myxococcaceae bacterium]
MALTRHVTLASTVLVATVATVASCASPSSTTGPRIPGSPSSPSPSNAATVPSTQADRVARHARPAVAQRPPPPRTTTAMKGEPSGAAASEARLVATTCEKASAEQIETRLQEMRAAVDLSFKEWHDGQPDCWEQSRQEARWRKAEEAMNDPSGGLAGVAAAPRAYSAKPADFGAALSAASGRPMPSAAPPPGPPPKSASAGGGTGGGAGGGGADKKKDSSPAAARSASGTNNQVASVDEADIVKTDGRYVYLAANGAL